MKVDRDLMAVIRRGNWQDKQLRRIFMLSYKKEHESAWILFYCLIICAMIALFVLTAGHN